MFGAPNGLCSSITESKHIKAVKKPWRRSNRFNALGQMLLTNQCLDKIAAAQFNFTVRGMMEGHNFAGALDAVMEAPELRRELEQEKGEEEEEEEEEEEVDDGPMCLGEVKLAKTPGLYSKLRLRLLFNYF